ncbi:MAG: hypothetical protein QW689_08985 [Nitrososphaerota archaeon]
MDSLARFIVDRVKCRFHPYIPQGDGWRRYPPHVARTLDHLEPLHIIAVTPTWVGIDGVYMNDVRRMHDKYSVALETVEAIFGETIEKEDGGNIELAALETGLWALKYFLGSIWFIAVCTDSRPYPVRFAFFADAFIPCARARYMGEECKVVGTVASADGAKISFPVSKKFFANPSTENVELFGDMLFLAQMEGGWVVNKEIDVDYKCLASFSERQAGDPYEHIASALMGCPGLESFLRHASIELVISDPHSESNRSWSSLVKAIEEARKSRP